ncbi:hypothetical protein MP638_006360 [Amoeboaphelidium occidentale]|nr:hypothetical protein MP638_006360 [Amoeboaphelidium occidentale]
MKKYKLFKAQEDDKLFHNIAKINTPKFDIKSLAVPVQLYRGDPNAPRAAAVAESQPIVNGQGEAPMDTDELKPAPDGKEEIKPKQIRFKRKTKLYYSTHHPYNQHPSMNKEKAAEQSIKKKEKFPWILQDSSMEEQAPYFVGKLEAEHSSNYVLFIYDDKIGGFRVQKVNGGLYLFRRGIAYRTLSVDEAEEQMKSKKVTMNRWMMRSIGQEQQQQSLYDKNGEKRTVKIGGMRQSVIRGNDDDVYEGDNFDKEDAYFSDDDLDELIDEYKTAEERKELRGKNNKDSEESEEEEDTEIVQKKPKKPDAAVETRKLLKKMNEDYFDVNEEDGAHVNSDGELFSESTDSSSEESSDEETKAKKSEASNAATAASETKAVQKKEDAQEKTVKPANVQTALPTIPSSRSQSPQPQSAASSSSSLNLSKKRKLKTEGSSSAGTSGRDKKMKIELNEGSLLEVFRSTFKDQEFTFKDLVKILSADFFSDKGKDILKKSMKKYCEKVKSDKSGGNGYKLKQEYQ